MTNSVILLMDKPEAEFFATQIRKRSVQLEISSVNSLFELEKVLNEENRRSNLFSFLTRTIVPPDILSKLDQAWNIHPGPPWMPGFRPTRKMVGKSDTAYGVTLHKMLEAVDAGPILAVRRFELPPNASLELVESITYKNAVQLALKHLDMIAGLQNVPHHPTERWGQR